VSSPSQEKAPKVLVIDVGGTHVKVLATGDLEEREIPSGQAMTASKMVRDVKVTNDAAMQALGSYQGGRILFGHRLSEPANPMRLPGRRRKG